VASSPGIGEVAPDFTLPSTEGAIRLSDRLKHRAVLLVFYPGDDTPVCTRQLCDYRDHLGAFEKLQVDVLGVNPQSLASHQKFADKHGLSFPLLADTHKSVCRDYGALGLLGMAKRALVLIAGDGKVRWRRTDLPVFHRSAAELEEVISGLSHSG
jgi:peroxiredoxin Q/BCP